MYNIPANSPRIDARTRKTKPGKVNLYIYAITVSSEAIMKLPLYAYHSDSIANCLVS